MVNQWDDVRRIAREVRLAINAELTGVVLAKEAIKQHNLLLQEYPAGDVALCGAQGVFDSPFILVDRSLPPTEMAWVLAHELGHAVLHTTSQSCSEEHLDISNTQIPLHYGAGRVDDYHPKKLTEQAANVFAAAFLLPADWLLDLFASGKSVAEIATAAGVTEMAVLHVLAGTLAGVGSTPESIDTLVAAPVPDESQEAAATVSAGPVLVSAGPGTGKTRTLIARIQHLLGLGYQPEQILALTFSNRAATEMRNRVRKWEPIAGPKVTVTTFHGFCLELLRRYHDRVGLPVDFTIIDDIDAVALLERHIQELPLDESRLFRSPGNVLKDIVATVSRAKDEQITPEGYMDLVNSAEETVSPDPVDLIRWREVAAVYPVYERLLLELGVTDYGGLITHCVTVLQREPELQDQLRSEFRHVLVDEYQDMNRASSQLLRLLAGNGAGLWVVGDLRQSIYRFRGASARNILDFESDFPGASTRELEMNYRSDAAIVELASVASSLPQGVKTSQQWEVYRSASTGPRITVARGSSPSAEALGIAATIRARLDRGLQLRDHVVLVKEHAQAQVMTEVLTRQGVPVCYLGDLFARSEIRAALCFLQLATSSNSAALLGVCELDEFWMPRDDRIRLISYACRHELPTLQALESAVHAGVSRSESLAACQRILDAAHAAGYAASPWILLSRFLFGPHSPVRRLQSARTAAATQQLLALGQLLAIAKTFADRPMAHGIEPTRLIPEFISFVRRLVANGRHIASAPEATLGLDAIQIMTVHSAKGLEFPYVFIPQLVDGKFPGKDLHRGIPPVPGLVPADHSSDEEALFFVALSRTEDELYLTWADTTESGKATTPSSFLGVIDELPDHVQVHRVEWNQDAAEGTEVSVPVQGACTTPLRLTPRRLSAFEKCPRSFEYATVHRLQEQFDPMPHRVFKSAVFSAWDWARIQEIERGVPAPEEILTHIAKFWQERVPETPLLTSKFAGGAAASANAMSDLLRVSAGALVEDSASDYKIAQVTFDTNINHIYRDSDSHIVGIRFVFGRGEKDHLDPALAVARRALEAYAGSSVDVKLQILDLVSGQFEEIPYSKSYEPKRVKKIEGAVEAIEGRGFPAIPSYHNCRHCSFWMICPA